MDGWFEDETLQHFSIWSQESVIEEIIILSINDMFFINFIS